MGTPGGQAVGQQQGPQAGRSPSSAQLIIDGASAGNQDAVQPCRQPAAGSRGAAAPCLQWPPLKPPPAPDSRATSWARDSKQVPGNTRQVRLDSPAASAARGDMGLESEELWPHVAAARSARCKGNSTPIQGGRGQQPGRVTGSVEMWERQGPRHMPRWAQAHAFCDVHALILQLPRLLQLPGLGDGHLQGCAED